MKGLFGCRWFGWCSAVIVTGYFIVGLWPFDFRPPNRVTWLPGRSGLHFENSGVAVDPELLPARALTGSGTNSSANFTLEIWAEADREPNDDVYNLLTIYNDLLPADFVICQWQRACILRATVQHPWPSRRSEVDARVALTAKTPKFITVRGDGAGTDFFTNGLLAGHFPLFKLKPAALSGQLILGNDSSGKHPWSGSLFGLAIYNRPLDAAEIVRDSAMWTQGQARQMTNEPGLTALYLFDEGGGPRAGDSSGNRHHIVIPEIFQPVHKEFLIAPWQDLSYDRPDYADIAVNIIGFVPFGFCFFCHRQFVRPNRPKSNFVFVVLVGALVSLTIEMIQAWLPNRVSSTTDLLTNIAGTLVGTVLALAMQPKTSLPESAPER